jgi:non-homologous end joining protein Ku
LIQKKDNEKTYALLVKILNENNLVAIGKVVPKGGKTYQGRENLQGSLEALKASIETKGSSTQKKPHVHSLSLIYVVTN